MGQMFSFSKRINRIFFYILTFVVIGRNAKFQCPLKYQMGNVFEHLATVLCIIQTQIPPCTYICKYSLVWQNRQNKSRKYRLSELALKEKILNKKPAAPGVLSATENYFLSTGKTVLGKCRETLTSTGGYFQKMEGTILVTPKPRGCAHRRGGFWDQNPFPWWRC